MGSPGGEGKDGDRQRHEVWITRPFYLGIHEVTQGQYQAVMGKNPSWFSAEGGGKDAVKGLSTDQHPVESVTWYDAVRFCNLLSKKEGLQPFYAIEGGNVRVLDWNATGYRLPTEAEWEYACRAGNQTRSSLADHEAELSRHAWFGEAFEKGTHPVGQKLANRWGLYDMHGNVWEWCWQVDEKSNNIATHINKKVREKANGHVLRGGSFGDPPAVLRSDDRNRYVTAFGVRSSGFRVARTSD